MSPARIFDETQGIPADKFLKVWPVVAILIVFIGGDLTKARSKSSGLSIILLLGLGLLLAAHPVGFFGISQVYAPTTGPTKIAFTSIPQTLTAGTCSAAVTVQSEDSLGNPSNVATATTVNLHTNSSAGHFYPDSACTTVTKSVNITASSSSASFFYLDTKAGSSTITASATGLTSATQTETINAATVSQLGFTTAAQILTQNLCSSIMTIQTQDAFGNPTTPGATVSLASNSTFGSFYTTRACATTTTSVSIPSGSSRGSFYYNYRSPQLGHPSITASSGTLNPASQVETVVPKIAINPPAIAGLSYGIGSTITFDVNVTNAPSINSFDAAIQYNPKVLEAAGIDFTSSSSYVLGQSPSVVYECIDDVSLVGGTCTPVDDVGVVHLFATVLGTTTVAPTNGPLFKVTFNVIHAGFSELHFLTAQVIGCNSAGICGQQVTSLSFDGYFTDINCGGTLCTPPFVSVTYSPTIVLTGTPVFFDATASSATNPGATIVSYNYFWSHGEGNTNTSNSTITHVFTVAAEHIVTVTENDTYGITGSVSILVNVLAVYVNIGVGSININPISGVTPGTPVNIVVTVVNHSTQNETINLHVVLDPVGSQRKDLKDAQFLNLTASTSAPPVKIVWDTTGYVAKVYQIEASVDPVPKQTDTSGLSQLSYVQLVSPQPAGRLSLTILSGIGVGVSLALLFGLGSLIRIFRRKPVDEDFTPK